MSAFGEEPHTLGSTVRGYVALGSNLGDREGSLRAGLLGMRRRGLPARALSSVWETEPVDSPEPLWFLNMVAEVETGLSPRHVLDLLLEVEREVGRVRSVRNAPRALDLDLLLLGDLEVEEEGLILPHPRMWARRFVLAPLHELAPELRDPRSGRTVAEALAALPPEPAARPRGPLYTPPLS
ncbi:MAG TPA: 2-amino-4-hydroxy-6-hydroxymethyldihydropteridine diphosphokinase [Candidatus Polarisedimenticolaceae bacterium]|nr:2-amino-4-hydroxy-6-hydroxymethyldihydropteridine diphosphokinase [Candidatus Polarisedimenticolaceae bacterium]